MKIFRSNGKLLLSGEYVVLDGAKSLAIPTKYGQSLTVESHEDPLLHWKSFDEKGNSWFDGTFEIMKDGELNALQKDETSKRLLQILYAVKTLNPRFFDDQKGFNVETHLDFPRNWGLGTSSTLINNIAQWTNIDAYKLLEMTFGGSGYDIACAQHNSSITFQLVDGKPEVQIAGFNPPFKEHLYFVYLNKKQNSREGIAHYKSLNTGLKPIISEINDITSRMITCKELNAFQHLVSSHEAIISNLNKMETVKSIYFNDFNGAIKSLGAWGGDFVLACSESNPTAYFNEKGFKTVIPYSDMVKPFPPSL
ncbi:GHMP kinase [Hyunsoonleella sp. SJ7]|uniref:GHMP kinase n=1 Tax=Hyunsoonleella aquatilis TaxID=2762758 RepID=A0A923H912_9FLAO|nr:GYDIA family GHMP kinase [Hyunsoonleella aquatilis]MBC3757137.1 GHMP kinase [Hyunsoonleella aquatilis]